MSNQDAGVSNTDLVGKPLPTDVDGQDPYTHSDSGNSGSSTTTNGGPGTAGAGAADNPDPIGDPGGPH
jgi:hypothetical protein